MKQYTLDPKALLGGIIAQDNDQEIVQLSLQKNNEIPTYETDAIILLLVLNGSAQIVSTQGTLETKGLQVVRLEPNEAHSIRALGDATNILVIKQLTHEAVLNKKLRFGTAACNLKHRKGRLKYISDGLSVYIPDANPTRIIPRLPRA